MKDHKIERLFIKEKASHVLHLTILKDGKIKTVSLLLDPDSDRLIKWLLEDENDQH